MTKAKYKVIRWSDDGTEEIWTAPQKPTFQEMYKLINCTTIERQSGYDKDVSNSTFDMWCSNNGGFTEYNKGNAYCYWCEVFSDFWSWKRGCRKEKKRHRRRIRNRICRLKTERLKNLLYKFTRMESYKHGIRFFLA